MRKGTSSLDQAGVGTAMRSASQGLGRRTPKKNARKRIILQEKISRELSASRNRVSDSQVRCAVRLHAFACLGRVPTACAVQANFHRCVCLAASLQV
jgi:hypothetical protein